MTRTLILVRHAKSSWQNKGLVDHERPLNDRGARSAAALGDWLRARNHLPTTVVSSDSTRTQETFRGLRLEVPVAFTRTLYHAGPEVMMDVLRGQEAASVLMLGHNPGIADFAARLVVQPPPHPRFDDYPTCATAVIRFDVAHWTDIGWRSGEVLDFVVPREVTGD